MLLLLAGPTHARENRYSVGGGGGMVRLIGGDFLEFDTEPSFGGRLAYGLSDRWQMTFAVSRFSFSNDTTVDSSASSGDLANDSPLDFEATRLNLLITRSLLPSAGRVNIELGAGGGLLLWKGVDPSTDATYDVRDDKGGPKDFSATELIVSGAAGIVIFPVRRLSIDFTGEANYLTGAGAQFEDVLASSRDRWLVGATASLNFHFGGSGPARRERSNSSSRRTARVMPPHPDLRTVRDGDGDGVPDEADDCLNTERDVVVDQHGCPVDSDRDGVPDGVDDCPDSEAGAVGMVDIHGCPVDSDFDGIPDYLDRCPHNAVGAKVDTSGCAIDTDGDGVPDGLDDCPGSMPDVAVDRYGCIDLSMLSEPMVLNIDYSPGSFEIDPHSKERLRKLAGLLNFVKDIRLDVNGYTDNIGTEVANKRLSEKRARRVRDFLVSLGIESDRINVYGRGETRFVASNQTAEGRAKNRRIEIVFYK
jgi:outer membrane protein OmpA-like peptidoglycan-associated protein